MVALFGKRTEGKLSPIRRNAIFDHLDTVHRRKIDVQLGNVWIGDGASEFEEVKFEDSELVIEVAIHGGVSTCGVTADILHSLLLDFSIKEYYYMVYQTMTGDRSFVLLDKNRKSHIYTGDFKYELISDEFGENYSDGQVFNLIKNRIDLGKMRGRDYEVAPVGRKFKPYQLRIEEIEREEIRLRCVKDKYDLEQNKQKDQTDDNSTESKRTSKYLRGSIDQLFGGKK